MNSGDLRQLFETAKEQELAHGLQGVRVVPIVSALLKAAAELDNAVTLLDRVYRAVGNSSPDSQRHALPPGLRDDIRDLLKASGFLGDFRHSIHCAGYRGSGNPFDESMCDCEKDSE